MVITGNSRLLMPNMPITLGYVTPSLSYPEHSLPLAVSTFYYCLNSSLIPTESLFFWSICVLLFSASSKALWFQLLWLKLELGNDRVTSMIANREKNFFSPLKKLGGKQREYFWVCSIKPTEVDFMLSDTKKAANRQNVIFSMYYATNFTESVFLMVVHWTQ